MRASRRICPFQRDGPPVDAGRGLKGLASCGVLVNSPSVVGGQQTRRRKTSKAHGGDVGSAMPSETIPIWTRPPSTRPAHSRAGQPGRTSPVRSAIARRRASPGGPRRASEAGQADFGRAWHMDWAWRLREAAGSQGVSDAPESSLSLVAMGWPWAHHAAACA